MSAFSGPEISNNGLVFYYDINNTEKSWRGKPTVNTCGFVDYTYGYNSTKIIGATPPVPPPIQATTVYKITSSDGNDSQQILYTAEVDQINGGTYTHSAYVYLESGSWVSVGQHWNPWDYGTQQYIPLGRWIRVEDPVTNDPNNYGNVALSYNTNGAVYVTASQYEIGSFATPFVLGTRSNTQAILDLTGQNTITAQNLSYSSDGLFTFDGTDDYISIPSATTLGINDVTTSWTMIVWFKTSGTGEYYFIDNYNGNTQDISFRIDNGVFEVYINSSNNYGMIYQYGSNFNNNNWTQFVLVWNGTAKSISTYANGNFLGTNSNTNMAGNFESGSSFNIGRRPVSSSYFPGSISTVSIFNRGLTAQEVAQNFQALRGRYSI